MASSQQESAGSTRELSRRLFWSESQIAALAKLLENFTADPDGLVNILRLDGRPIGPLDPAVEGLDLLRPYFQAAAEEIAENRHAIQALHDSWPWRLTAPFRSFLDGAVILLGVAINCGRGLVHPAKITGVWQWFRFRKLVNASGLFDEQYYLRSNPDVRELKIHPLFHFFVFGAREGRNPHLLFDVLYYRATNAELRGSCRNPLVHYLHKGAYEGCDPHPAFDSSFYLEQNSDVRNAGWNPLCHYLGPGVAEGRDPNSWFRTAEYLTQHPDVAARGLNPLIHHMTHQRRKPLDGGTLDC